MTALDLRFNACIFQRRIVTVPPLKLSTRRMLPIFASLIGDVLIPTVRHTVTLGLFYPILVDLQCIAWHIFHFQDGILVGVLQVSDKRASVCPYILACNTRYLCVCCLVQASTWQHQNNVPSTFQGQFWDCCLGVCVCAI